MRALYFITHPDVVVDPSLPVPAWPLSTRGLARMRRLLAAPWVARLGSVYASTEQKALDGARVLATAHGLEPILRADLGERDRSSTGYLPADEFRAAVTRAFAHPEERVRGWEASAEAQRRIVRAIDAICRTDTAGGDIAVVSHGAVGALYLCHATARPIGPAAEQPGRNGGNYFAIEVASRRLVQGWTPIDGGDSA